MTTISTARPARLLLLALLATFAQAGCCFDFSFGPAMNRRFVQVGGETIITEWMTITMDEEIGAVRDHIRAAGFVEPWPMLAGDGRGLLIEDRGSDAAPLLVWSDWTSGDPPVALAGAREAQLISARHFIYRADGDEGELRLASLAAPEQAAPVDAGFDPLRVRGLPRLGIWAAIDDDRLYTGRLADGITTASATAIPLGAEGRHIAVLEDSAVALIETADGVVTVHDLLSGDMLGEPLEGVIDWPYVLEALEAYEGWLIMLSEPGIEVIGAEERWSVTTDADRQLQVTPTSRYTLVESKDGVHTIIDADREPGEPLPEGVSRTPRTVLLGAPEYRGIVWPPYLGLSAYDPAAVEQPGTELVMPLVPYGAAVPLPAARPGTADASDSKADQ